MLITLSFFTSLISCELYKISRNKNEMRLDKNDSLKEVTEVDSKNSSKGDD